MHITERFSKKDIDRYAGEKKLQQLHGAINNIFQLPNNVIQSPDPVKRLNELISDQSIFAFSFVRHPHTRYEEYIYISILIKI